MLEDPFQRRRARASYNRIKELVEHADYKPSMEEAMRGWCDGLACSSAAFCEMWKEQTLKRAVACSQRELT